MRLVLQQWVAEDARMAAPAGRWAIERRHDGGVIGGATLLCVYSYWTGSGTLRVSTGGVSKSVILDFHN